MSGSTRLQDVHIYPIRHFMAVRQDIQLGWAGHWGDPRQAVDPDSSNHNNDAKSLGKESISKFGQEHRDDRQAIDPGLHSPYSRGVRTEGTEVGLLYVSTAGSR
ncbi:uncharacterized protein N7459_006096 [Penicillium hispanicum]|uniref:uncharacterized protein n=1 Tax=Penicillium hispanicum TaxID=1080232 RepID=UPI00253F8AE5|nr:uncharacterized protein N7459_006096 [Penicillium hispanicum]KAJ5580111.1 hypothetical protein N7459_006096 [Penicillium hispanicum]